MSTVACRSNTVYHDRLQSAASRPAPYLEYLAANGGNLRRVTVDTLPFRLGRAAPSEFIIPSGQISRVHAEVYQTSGQLHVRDLQSTNGTFLNGRRIQDAPLTHGDILHLAHQEFRFLIQEEEEESDLDQTDFSPNMDNLPPSILYNLPILRDLIRQRLVRTFFQPILTLDSREIRGYEALGRGAHGKLSARPGDLFALAESCELAAKLSQVFRAVAVAEARGLPGRPGLFLNTHPTELHDSQLLASMRLLRDNVPAEQPLVSEVHEATMADVAVLRRLRDELHGLDIGLAYDDFGAGQSRLGELIEVPPDYVKLDMALIRGLHQSAPRQCLVRAITRVALDLNVQVLAEGIETEAEAEACQRLGCTLGQGFLLGHPQAALAVPEEDTWRVNLGSPVPDDNENLSNNLRNSCPRFVLT